MIEYGKLQAGCLLIILYVAYIYYRERYAYRVKKKERIANVRFNLITLIHLTRLFLHFTG